MSNTVILDETIEVQRPLHEVFAYVSEFSRVQEWDPAVCRATRLTAGAPGVDSEFEVVLNTGISLHYRITEFEEDSRMAMTVKSRFFTAREEILFEAIGSGTRVRYIADFDFPAPLAALNWIYPAGMDRIGAGLLCDPDDVVHIEVGLDRPLALADPVRLPRIETMQGQPILGRVDADGRNVQLTSRAEYADRYFAAVGDEDLVEHSGLTRFRDPRDCHTQRRGQQLRVRRSPVRQRTSHPIAHSLHQ